MLHLLLYSSLVCCQAIAYTTPSLFLLVNLQSAKSRTEKKAPLSIFKNPDFTDNWIIKDHHGRTVVVAEKYGYEYIVFNQQGSWLGNVISLDELLEIHQSNP